MHATISLAGWMAFDSPTYRAFCKAGSFHLHVANHELMPGRTINLFLAHKTELWQVVILMAAAPIARAIEFCAAMTGWHQR
jgi:hypothetical protein